MKYKRPSTSSAKCLNKIDEFAKDEFIKCLVFRITLKNSFLIFYGIKNIEKKLEFRCASFYNACLRKDVEDLSIPKGKVC